MKDWMADDGDWANNMRSPFAPMNAAPTIFSFTATPSSGGAGAAVTLTWSVNYGQVSIDNGIGNVPTSGSIVVNPAVTTTYTLSARSFKGAQSQAQATYTVSGGGDPFWNQVVMLFQGTSLADATGRHTLVANDGVVTSSGGFLQFDGASSVQVQGNVGDFLTTGKKWTFESEIVPGSFASSQVFWCDFNDGNPAGGFEAYVGANASFGVWGDNTPVLESAPAILSLGVPVQVALSLDIDVSLVPTLRGYVAGNKQFEIVGGAAANYGKAGVRYLGRQGIFSPAFYTGGWRGRFTLDVARYTGNSYVLPTYPLPTSL